MCELLVPTFLPEFNAINVLAVVNARGRYMAVELGAPGSNHDAFVYRTSGILQWVNSLPEGYMLVGDSGFGASARMLTPLPRRREVSTSVMLVDFELSVTCSCCSSLTFAPSSSCLCASATGPRRCVANLQQGAIINSDSR